MNKNTYIDNLKRLSTIIMALNENNVITVQEIRSSVNSNDFESKANYIHNQLHYYWNSYKKNKPVKGYDRPTIIRLHTALVTEMLKKKIKHVWLSELDDTLPLVMKKQTEKSPDSKKAKH